jgi:YegS/Rv2252/BmrU family lipid kinase
MMALPGEKRRPVGYIPAGSTNDFGGSLGLPRNMKQAAVCLTKDQPFLCDMGAFNENYFVYIAAFGAFTDVSYQTKQEIKNVLGHLAYVLEGAKRLFNLKSYHMKLVIGEEEIEDDFIYGMVTNSKSVGGFRNITGKNVQLDDGLFEVTMIRTPKNPIELQEILGAILTQEMDNKLIYFRKAAKVHFESLEAVSWTLDGEFGGEHKRVDIVNCRQAVAILANGQENDEKTEEKYAE